MKRGVKISFIMIIILTLFCSAIYLFLIFQGKAIIIRELGALTHKKVTIEHFNIKPPLNLEIKNLEVEGLVKIKSLSISPSILLLVMGKIGLNGVILEKPEFTYERGLAETSPATAAETTTTVVTSTPATKATATLKKKQPLSFILKHLYVKEGRVNFVDHGAGTDGIKIVVKDINLKLTNAYAFPRSVITNFELSGRIPWQQGKEEGKIEAEGWLNLLKRDMQATLKISDIDGIYLYPYYSQWVNLEKTRIEKATLNFTSDIRGLNNNVTAECHLELSDIVRKPLSPEESEEKAAKIAAVVIDIFKALNQGKIVLDFTIRTRMDRPEFGFGNIKMAFEDKLAQGRKATGFNLEEALKLPARIIEDTFRGATDLTKSVIVGTINAGKEIAQAVEDTLKKEKKQ